MHCTQSLAKDLRDERKTRALLSLAGLSVGDAFGECFLHLSRSSAARLIAHHSLPQPPWRYTDDTQMALSIVQILIQNGRIDQDLLARSFAERYDPSRGYGWAMHGLLRRIRDGEAWHALASQLFGGQGSYGNGAAMRVAPLGAYFADDLAQVVEQARRSAEVTHAHAEAVVGAVAVAVAAASAWRLRKLSKQPVPPSLLAEVLPLVPDSAVRAGLESASRLPPGTPVSTVVRLLGNGSRISAQDTVPFALWCAAQHLDDFEAALWLTVRGLGDIDTNCAIVGGIVAVSAGPESIPEAWLLAREPLPNWHLTSPGQIDAEGR